MAAPERWFAEAPRGGFQQAFAVRAELYRGASRYQEILVLDTEPFGRTLVLDGAVQTTERDEYVYHEMLAHPALCTHPEPRRVLVIGGGDGGCLRRVLEHPVDLAVQVEIDRDVVEVSQRYLPTIAAGAYADARARLLIADGVQYLTEGDERFDIILVDSTDPVGPAAALFAEPFYRAARRALGDRGVLVTQSGSPLLMAEELRATVAGLRAVFPIVRPYLANVPSYPGVLWSFCAASVASDPLAVGPGAVAARLAASGIVTHYYTPELHRAAFALPAFLGRFLADLVPDGNEAPRAAVSG